MFLMKLLYFCSGSPTRRTVLGSRLPHDHGPAISPAAVQREVGGVEGNTAGALCVSRSTSGRHPAIQVGEDAVIYRTSR